MKWIVFLYLFLHTMWLLWSIFNDVVNIVSVPVKIATSIVDVATSPIRESDSKPLTDLVETIQEWIKVDE